MVAGTDALGGVPQVEQAHRHDAVRGPQGLGDRTRVVAACPQGPQPQVGGLHHHLVAGDGGVHLPRGVVLVQGLVPVVVHAREVAAHGKHHGRVKGHAGGLAQAGERLRRLHHVDHDRLKVARGGRDARGLQDLVQLLVLHGALIEPPHREAPAGEVEVVLLHVSSQLSPRGARLTFRCATAYRSGHAGGVRRMPLGRGPRPLHRSAGTVSTPCPHPLHQVDRSGARRAPSPP